MAKPAASSDTRQQLLRAALKHFANSGYAATSVQDIVDDAKLSKPALYYHFKDKAGLFQAPASGSSWKPRSRGSLTIFGRIAS